MAHEKEVLENQLEAEQEYIVHKLQKQAAHIAGEKQALQLEKGDLKRQVHKLHVAHSVTDIVTDYHGHFCKSALKRPQTKSQGLKKRAQQQNQ